MRSIVAALRPVSSRCPPSPPIPSTNTRTRAPAAAPPQPTHRPTTVEGEHDVRPRLRRRQRAVARHVGHRPRQRAPHRQRVDAQRRRRLRPHAASRSTARAAPSPTRATSRRPTGSSRGATIATSRRRTPSTPRSSRSGDKPAGYVYRLEPQVGYARLFFKTAHQLLPRRNRLRLHLRASRAAAGRRAAQRRLPLGAPVRLLREQVHARGRRSPRGSRCSRRSTTSRASASTASPRCRRSIYKNIALKVNFTLHFNNDPALRPSPTAIDPATGMIYVLPPTIVLHFGKVDTQLDVVIAVTFL